MTMGRIRAEWDPLRKVVVHRPGIEMFFGLLELYAALYERAFSRYEARMEHERMEHVLRHEFKVEVIRMKETILDAADRDSSVRSRLVNKAHETITFEGGTTETEKAREALMRNADALDSQHFFNMLLMNPLIDLESGKGTRTIQLNMN